MLKSNLCILNKLSPEITKNMGEDPSDLGGYFIIDGKEKVIVSQEKFADNMIYIRDDYNEIYSTSCEVRSVKRDAELTKPHRESFETRFVEGKENGNQSGKTKWIMEKWNNEQQEPTEKVKMIEIRVEVNTNVAITIIIIVLLLLITV